MFIFLDRINQNNKNVQCVSLCDGFTLEPLSFVTKSALNLFNTSFGDFFDWK